jgi:hypothetical protein
VKGDLFGVKGDLFGVKGDLNIIEVTVFFCMNDIAMYRNDYPLLSRSKPLSPKAATLEALIISKICPTKKVNQMYKIEVPRSLFGQYGICDLANDHYFRDLDLLAEELVTYRISLPEMKGYQARWRPLVSQFDVHDSNLVTIGIDEDLAPYLIELKEKFTQLEVVEVATLSNQYSKKMYMLLKTVEFKGGGTFSLEEIHDSLGTSDIKTYQEFKNFSRKVLKPSLKELNDKSDIYVVWETIRYRRKVGAIEFKVSKNMNHQPKLQIVEAITDEVPHEIRVFLDAYGFNDDVFIESILKQFDAELLLEATQLFDKRMSNTSITNKAGLYRLRIHRYIDQVLSDRKRKQGLEEALQDKEMAEAAFLAEKAKWDRKAKEYAEYHKEELYEKLDDVSKSMFSIENCPMAMLEGIALDLMKK